MNFVDEAISELNVALMQSGPEDDQIIMGRVRNALQFLKQQKREEKTGCPECGSQDFRVVEYDFGCSSETGYSDSGERGICSACGCNSDIDDFVPRVPRVVEAA